MASTDTALPPEPLFRSRVGARIGELLLFASLGGVVTTFVWASRRGFDLTDEGYYLQLYARAEEGPRTGSTQFNRLVDLLSGGWELGIVGYRLAGLLLLVGCSVLLAYAVYMFIRAFHSELARALPSRTGITAFVALAGLLGYAWLPLTLSYNTIATGLAQVIVALVLVSLGNRHAGVRRGLTVVLEMTAGLSVSLLFFVKWPSAIVLMILIVVFCVGVLGRLQAARPLATIVGSALVWSLVVTQAVSWFSFNDLFSGISQLASGGHNPSELLWQYAADIREALLATVLDSPLRLVALGALLSGGFWIGRPNRRRRNLHFMMCMAGAIYVLVEAWDAPYFSRTSKPSFIVSVLVAVAIISVTVLASTKRPISEDSLSMAPTVWLLALLLALPPTVALGTNNSIFTGSLVAAAGYGAFLVVILAVLGSRSRSLLALQYSLALPVLGFVLAAQVFNGVVADPYRLPTSRLNQTEPVAGVERMRGIMLDPPGARFIEAVHRVVYEQTAFRPGDRVIAFAKLPGLVYILDGVGPGDLWIHPPETGNQAADCEELAVDAENVALTTLILQNDEPSPELKACLTELIPAYPGDFVEVGRVPIPGDYGAGTGSGTILQVLALRGGPAGPLRLNE